MGIEINTIGLIWISEGAPKVQAPKIVGGYPAAPGQVPFQGAIIVDNGIFCGCSLIAQQYVLTAAHCVYQG